jgi:hypothetical protein
MMRRIWVLTAYFGRRGLLSLNGLLYLLSALLFWYFFFPPQQGTPQIANYMLLIGTFGAAVAFLLTLTITAQANQVAHYPLLVRLPSRVEYLTAVLLATLMITLLLQSLVALLSLYNGPGFSLRLLELPPLWLSLNVLAIVLALHASDFVTAGWSRVYVYGTLAVLIVSQNSGSMLSQWLTGQLNTLGRYLIRQGMLPLGNQVTQLSNWFQGDGGQGLTNLLGIVFWPFQAILDAIIAGGFNVVQALAPAVLLLYATILFMLAADLFATKDIEFTE